MRPEESETTDGVTSVDTPAQKSEAVKLCGAPLRKKPGVFCRKPVAPDGNGRCPLHGQNARRGPDHARWKGGAFSKYLPRDLRERYEKWLRDPQLLAGRNEVAILKARLQELTARLNQSGESGEAWRSLQEAFAELQRAKVVGDEPATAAAVTRLQAIIDGANANERAWEEWVALCERSTLIAQRESRRVLEARLYATAEQVRAIVSSISHAVLLYVNDPITRKRIADHVNGLRVLSPDEVDEIDRRTLHHASTGSATGE